LRQRLRIQPEQALLAAKVLLARHGAHVGRLLSPFILDLVKGDCHEEPPQIAILLEDESALACTGEKAAADRLHDVLRIHALGEAGGEMLPRQGDQPASVALEEFGRRLLVPIAPARYQGQGFVVQRAKPRTPNERWCATKYTRRASAALH